MLIDRRVEGIILVNYTPEASAFVPSVRFRDTQGKGSQCGRGQCEGGVSRDGAHCQTRPHRESHSLRATQGALDTGISMQGCATPIAVGIEFGRN